MDENALLLDALRGRVDELYFAWSPAVLEMLLSESAGAVRRDSSQNFRIGKNGSQGGALQIVRVRGNASPAKTDTNRLVTQRGCNTAASFGLSDLKQTSEQPHKQFALHFEQLTAS